VFLDALLGRKCTNKPAIAGLESRKTLVLLFDLKKINYMG
jgi:hypothetical protein